MSVPFLKNPKRLVISNPRKKGANVAARKRTTKKGMVRKTARRAYTPAQAKYFKRGGSSSRPRRRRNPAHAKRRPRRRRSNPVIPGGMIGQMLMVAAGYLATPILSNMVPWQPATLAGDYLKRAGTVVVGSQLLGKAVGKKFGNALFVGGMISIAVDVLRNYVPALGGNALAPGVPAIPAGAVPSDNGMGYYFPPDAELGALYAGDGNGVAAIAAATGLSPGESVARFANRF